VDGVCCSSFCTGDCRACNILPPFGTLGSCSYRSSGSDPENDCGLYTCNGTGACYTTCTGGVCTSACENAAYCDTIANRCAADENNGSACYSGCMCESGSCCIVACC
jgi:hypothetical protein